MDYAFDELIRDLSMGREIEFEYAGRKFSLTHTPNGWSLAEFYKGNEQTFPSYRDVLEYGTVDGTSLRDIWPATQVIAIY